MKYLPGAAALIMVLCGILLIVGIGNQKVVMGVTVISLGCVLFLRQRSP